MASSLLRLLQIQEAQGLTEEEIREGIAAVEAQISSLKSQKRFYMKINTPSSRKRWGDADEEQQMLERLLAEYKSVSDT